MCRETLQTSVSALGLVVAAGVEGELADEPAGLVEEFGCLGRRRAWRRSAGVASSHTDAVEAPQEPRLAGLGVTWWRDGARRRFWSGVALASRHFHGLAGRGIAARGGVDRGGVRAYRA